MLSRIVSYLVNNQSRVAGKTLQQKSLNPFNQGKIFLDQKSETYGKNMPLKGGLFAGYYNGKPNIVGRRLFIEA